MTEDHTKAAKGESTLSRVHTQTIDPQMDAAIAQARATTGDFLNAFSDPNSAFEDFAVKKLYVANGYAEHIWVENLTIEGGQIRGTSGNDSPGTIGVRFGDQAEVELDEITDWMYTDDGVLVGGFTVRVVYGRLNTEQRARFDQDAPYRVE